MILVDKPVQKCTNQQITDARKCGNCDALQLEPPDVAPVVLRYFWPNLYSACAETASEELPVKILTSQLDLATQIS